MWGVLLGVWLVCFVLLALFYLESEVRWRERRRDARDESDAPPPTLTSRAASSSRRRSG